MKKFEVLSTMFATGTDDNIVWGRLEGSNDDVFRLYLDESDNSLWLSQFEPIKHTPPTGPDQIATIANKIHVTVTDTNNNTATAPLLINIVDDGIDESFRIVLSIKFVTELLYQEYGYS